MAPRFVLAALTLSAASTLGAKDGPTARARAVLRSSGCGSCHDSGVSAENRAALAVYDLVEPEWPARMSDAQLPKLLGRLKSAPALDRKIVREFIATELKARSSDRR